MPSTSLSQTVTDISFDATNSAVVFVTKAAGSVSVSLKGGNSVPAIPSGTVVMYNGTTAPTGWNLCNGSNGTPDLRNRFIYAWGSEGVGSFGGASSQGTSANGSHSHSISASGSSLTTSQMPMHTHVPAGYYAGWPDGGSKTSGIGYQYHSHYPQFVNNNKKETSGSGANEQHSHSGSTSTDGNHAHTVTTIPPYLRLVYIMKI